MHKISFFMMLLLLVCTEAKAQQNTHAYYEQFYKGRENKLVRFQKEDTLDFDHTECIYHYSVTDSTLMKTRKSYEILQIGKSFSFMQEYDTFRQDSCFHVMGLDRVREIDYYQVVERFPGQRSHHIMIKDHAKGEVTEEAYFGFNYNTYTEPAPQFDWTLCEDTMTVCGYLCQKATTCFRGRRWTVWYCDLPLSEGPWKFQGLPGLILQAEDASRHHVFEAVGIRKSSQPIVRKESYPYRSNRKRFIDMYNEVKTHPFVPEGTQAWDQFGNPAKPASYLFHNAIEME